MAVGLAERPTRRGRAAAARFPSASSPSSPARGPSWRVGRPCPSAAECPASSPPRRASTGAACRRRRGRRRARPVAQGLGEKGRKWRRGPGRVLKQVVVVKLAVSESASSLGVYVPGVFCFQGLQKRVQILKNRFRQASYRIRRWCRWLMLMPKFRLNSTYSSPANLLLKRYVLFRETYRALRHSHASH